MGISAYTKTAWANGVAPAINATNLNKIEDRLYDLTEEIITPTMASTTTATQQIISLPSTTLKSRLDLTLAGNTAVNIINNGNFANGTTSWFPIYGTGSVSNNEYTYTVTTLSSFARIEQPTPIGYPEPIATHKYYCRGEIYPKYSNTTYFQVGTGSIITILPTANTWNTISGIATAIDNTRVRFFHRTNTNYALTNTFKFKNIMVINLTEIFGAGNEPTQAQADLMFANWFDGVKSTNRQIVKSVGKNLFDGTVVSLSGQVETKILSKSSFTLKAISNSAIGVINLFPNIKFRENTRYRFFYNFFEDDDTKNSRIRIDYTDGTFTNGSAPRLILTSSGFSSDENKTIKGISYTYSGYNGTTTYQDFQIQEFDKTPYVYEPYTETTAIMPTELKKISSTIYDTYDANSGQHTKNVEETEISGTVYASIDTSTYTNVDVVKTTAFTLMKPATASVDSVTRLFDKTFKQLEEVAQADIDLVASAGKYYVHTDETIWFIVANGTYADIATARTGLGTSTLLYQLTTPIVTNYYPNTLTAEPNGTIYTYPFVQDYDFYDTGAGISNTGYPIDSLEYVNIVDKQTGALTPVDLSTCTIASGGLSFTSTALTASDLVDFGYSYKDLTTVAEVIYSHPTDLKATVDGNTNNIRDLDEKIEQSNTVTTLTLKEIERDARILKIMGGI